MLALAPVGLLLGPAILMVGLVAPAGLVALRLAISRNQEFNADVGAVELTRNPAGLLCALRKLLAAERRGAAFPSSLAPLCIAPLRRGMTRGLSWRFLLSTHPPLEERIRRIEAMVV